VPTAKTLLDLPSDPEALKALLSSLLLEREVERQRAEELRQSLELKVEQLRHELELLKKRYYGPRADKLRSMAELGQLLLAFSEELMAKPVNAGDVASDAKPERELRWVRRRKGRRNLAAFENLPVQTIVHELSAEERICGCCGVERQEIGAEVSWQIEYTPAHFERIEHVRKKYACAHCDREGLGAQIIVAEKPASPIEKGMAGPGLLAYIVTSKYADFLPLYRLENIFERIGCEISRSTQSVWCGDVADLITPLYERMADRVRQSHVILTDDTPMPMQEPGLGKTRRARMWVYLGDESQPYNVFHFTESRKRDGPLEFLRDYNQVLVADAYGGYDGVVAGNGIARLQPPSLIVSLDWPPPASVNVLPTDFLSGRQEVRRCHKPSSNSSLNFPSSAVMSSTGFG
jgi:transposase